MDIYEILGREEQVFQSDLEANVELFKKIIPASKFLVIGGAGTIGSAVCEILMSFMPKKLHVVDISENNLVELVRKLRSKPAVVCADFDTYAIDYCSSMFHKYLDAHNDFDFVLNLAALKHVRSEKDIFTLFRMLDTNIFAMKRLKKHLIGSNVKKIFCVSTDKAANPANLMGASKKLMERYLFLSDDIPSSSARFANVAFSDGSLLHGFNKRLECNQPISIPSDIQRFFMTSEEAGYLCLFSCILGGHADIFVPKTSSKMQLTYFKDILERFLSKNGLRPIYLASEQEARTYFTSEAQHNLWPCFLFDSDTTGEKLYEEFHTKSESVESKQFHNINVVHHAHDNVPKSLKIFENEYTDILYKPNVKRSDVVEIVKRVLPELSHVERNKNLNDRM
jgi:UDP-N-acetylglucosamine 4,6-dehydratase